MDAHDNRNGSAALVTTLESDPRLLAPNARFLELNCGQVTYAEQPEQFADAVATFASEIGLSPMKPAHPPERARHKLVTDTT